MLEIKSTTQNARVPVTIIQVAGNVDASTASQFQSYSDQAIADGATYLLLDLGQVDFMSSAGLRAIHNLFNKLRELHKDTNDEELRKKMSAGAYKSPHIKIANMNPRVQEAFELGGFETYIEVYSEITSAINSF